MRRERENIAREREDRRTTCIIWATVFILSQVLMLGLAAWNGVLEIYFEIAIFQIILGIVGLTLAFLKQGNHRLVVYGVSLLSLGQLVQVSIYHKDGLEAYASYYSKNMMITCAALVIMWFIFRGLSNWFSREYAMKVTIVVLSLMILSIFVLLRSPLGRMENGARISVKIAGMSLQLVEFLKPLTICLMAALLYRPKLSGKRVTAAYLVLLAIGGLTVVLCREFGTALIVLITGTVILWIFQHCRWAKGPVTITGVGVALLILLFSFGNRLYKQIPMQVSAAAFAKNYTACAETRNNLADFMESYLEDKASKSAEHLAEEGKATLQEEEAKANEALLAMGYSEDAFENEGFTYEFFTSFLSGVQNVYIRNAANALLTRDENGKLIELENDKQIELENSELAEALNNNAGKILDTEELTKNAEAVKRLVDMMTAMAENEDFRQAYVDKVIGAGVYSTATENAFNEELEREGSTMKAGIIKKLFVNVYYSQLSKMEGRFTGFLDHEGSDQKEGYQVNRALAAMATGGLFGNGANSYTTIYAWDTDMVFAAAVAELGLIVGILILLLTMLIVHEMIFTGIQSCSYLLQAVCLGFGGIWAIQSILIVAGCMRLAPLTGVTMPLVARGGTSWMDCLLMIALVLYISIDKELENALCQNQVTPEKDLPVGEWNDKVTGKVTGTAKKLPEQARKIGRQAAVVKEKTPAIMKLQRGSVKAEKKHEKKREKYDLFEDILGEDEDEYDE